MTFHSSPGQTTHSQSQTCLFFGGFLCDVTVLDAGCRLGVTEMLSLRAPKRGQASRYTCTSLVAEHWT